MRHYSDRSSVNKAENEAAAPPSSRTDALDEQAGAYGLEPTQNIDREDISDYDTAVVDSDDEGPYVEGDNIMYSTGDVAARLHISRDMARNHIRDFEEFLHVSKTRDGKYGHTSIRSTDMETLEHIVRLRKNRHSVEQVKQILRDPYLAGKLSVPTADFSELLNESLARNNAALLAEVQRIFDSNRLLLEENAQKSDQIQELAREVEELRGLAKEQKDVLTAQADALNDQYDVIKEQTAVLNSVKTMLDDQASNKKKGFFGLFK